MDNFIPSKTEEEVWMNVQNPWTITKIIMDFEKSVKILVLSFEDMKIHIFKHWMKDMVMLIKKGNKEEVELVDVTGAANSKNHQASNQMMEPSKDYIIACENLFANLELRVGDEIGLYWDTRSNNLKFKIIEKGPFYKNLRIIFVRRLKGCYNYI
ncbi:hypothetical protein P3S68_024705 [Capsicum galapagoense]